MKKTLGFLSVLFVSLLSARAQNADPYISISMRPATVQLGATTTLEILEGNFAFDPICPNALIITVSVGPNAQILGIATGSDPRWVISTLTTGSANTIRMTNANGGFGELDLGYVYLTVKAVSFGGPNNVGANMAYIIENNPCSGGAPNMIHGNSNIENDNGVTSLTVPIPGPLSLKFTGFNVSDKGCSGSVSWTTAEEEHVSHFDVQQSFDGNSFTTLRTVASKGDGGHSYELAVTQPQKMMYYRVIGVDIDNKKSYGAIKALQLANCTQAAIVQVFPVPAARNQNITMQTNSNDKITYRLVDISGKVVQTGIFVRTKQIGGLNSGMYLLEMTSAGFKETQTIIVQ